MKLTDISAQLEAALVKPAPVGETVVVVPIVDDTPLLETRALLFAKKQEFQQLQETHAQHLANHTDLQGSLLTLTLVHKDVNDQHLLLTDSHGNLR